MARLRSPVDKGEAWTSRAWLEPVPDPRAKRRNGRYKGKLPVREVRPGVSGRDLDGGRPTPAPGQVWRRGEQLVSVLRLEETCGLKVGHVVWVVFRELNFGKAVRKLRLSHFRRTSHLERRP